MPSGIVVLLGSDGGPYGARARSVNPEVARGGVVDSGLTSTYDGDEADDGLLIGDRSLMVALLRR